MQVTETERVKEWHLDRKVTISLILALLVNAGATVWFAAQLDQRVAHLEDEQVRDAETPERMARVETQVEALGESLSRIERKIDRAIEKR